MPWCIDFGYNFSHCKDFGITVLDIMMEGSPVLPEGFASIGM